MKTWIIEKFGLQDFEGLKQIERPEPQPGPRDVLIKMRAFSLNYRDLMVSRGTYGSATPEGIVPLSDGAGEVIAVGHQVTRLEVGDRVAPIFNQYWMGGSDFGEVRPGGDLGGTIDGVLAEKVVLPEEGVVILPDSLSYEDAATLPCAGVTAWNALMVGRPARPGDILLVQGSGGVSVMALMLGKFLGMRVIATTSSGEKADRLRALGADEVINYKSDPEWGPLAKTLTDGRGVDRVVEVGGPGTFAQSMSAVRAGGSISVVGLLGGASGEINPLKILHTPMSVHGIRVGSRADFEGLLECLKINPIKHVVDKVFDFDDAKEAFRHFDAQNHFGKVVLTA